MYRCATCGRKPEQFDGKYGCSCGGRRNGELMSALKWDKEQLKQTIRATLEIEDDENDPRYVIIEPCSYSHLVLERGLKRIGFYSELMDDIPAYTGKR